MLRKSWRGEATPLSLGKAGPKGGDDEWQALQIILRGDLQSLQIPHPSPTLQAHSNPTPPRVTVQHGAVGPDCGPALVHTGCVTWGKRLDVDKFPFLYW